MTFYDVYDDCHIMRFVGYDVWRLMTFAVYDICRLIMFVAYDVCHHVMFVAYYVCHHMMFVAYDVCHLIMFVAYEICRLMTFVADQVFRFVAYDVCRSTTYTVQVQSSVGTHLPLLPQILYLAVCGGKKSPFFPPLEQIDFGKLTGHKELIDGLCICQVPHRTCCICPDLYPVVYHCKLFQIEMNKDE